MQGIFFPWDICRGLPRPHYLTFLLLPTILTFLIRLLFFSFSALYFCLVRSSSETVLIVWTRAWKLLANKISGALRETSMCLNILYYLDVSVLDISCLSSSVTEESTDVSAFGKWKVSKKCLWITLQCALYIRKAILMGKLLSINSTLKLYHFALWAAEIIA